MAGPLRDYRSFASLKDDSSEGCSVDAPPAADAKHLSDLPPNHTRAAAAAMRGKRGWIRIQVWIGIGIRIRIGFGFRPRSAAICGNLRRVAAICGEPRHARHPKRTAAHLIFSFLPDAPSDTLILPRICVPGFSTFPSKSTNRVPLGAWGFPGAARAKRGIYVPRFSPPPSERRIHAGAPKNPGIIGILDKSPRRFSVVMTTKKFFTNA